MLTTNFDDAAMEVLGPLFEHLAKGLVIPINFDKEPEKEPVRKEPPKKIVKIKIQDDTPVPGSDDPHSMKEPDEDDSEYCAGTNVFLPRISSVHFYENIEHTVDGDLPMTVTKVTFCDSSTATVKRHPSDNESKETAVAYCILKRIFGTVDDEGNVSCKNLFSMLHEEVKGATYHYEFDRPLARANFDGCCDGQCESQKYPDPEEKSKPIRDSRGRFAKRK